MDWDPAMWTATQTHTLVTPLGYSPKGGSNGGKGPDDASSGKAEEGQDPNSSPPVTTDTADTADTAETTEASEDDCTPFYGRDYTRKQDPKNNQELPGGDSSYDSIDQLSGMVQNLDLASDGVPYSRFSAAGETQTSDFPSSQGEATASGEMSISSNRPTNYPEIPSIWGDSTTTPCDPALYPPDANSSFPSDNRVASSFSDPESHLFETTSHLLTSSYASPSTDAYSDSRSSAYSDFSPTTLPDNPLGFAYSILSFSDQSNLTFPDSTFESSGHKDYSSGGNDSYY